MKKREIEQIIESKIEPKFANIIRCNKSTQRNIAKIQKIEKLKYKNDAVVFAINKLANSYAKNNRTVK